MQNILPAYCCGGSYFVFRLKSTMSDNNVGEARIAPDAKAPTPREIIEDIAAENGVFPLEFKLQAMQGDDDKRKLMKSNERLKAKLTNAVKRQVVQLQTITLMLMINRITVYPTTSTTLSRGFS